MDNFTGHQLHAEAEIKLMNDDRMRVMGMSQVVSLEETRIGAIGKFFGVILVDTGIVEVDGTSTGEVEIGGIVRAK